MKKILLALLVLSLLVPAVAMAQDTEKKTMPGMGMPGMGKMCPSMMSGPQMIAAGDGGVIVLAGPKLLKYDANLNLINEAELPKPTPPKNGQGPAMGDMAEQAVPSSPETQV